MASIEESASGELELSADQLEAGCSGIHPKRKTEIAPAKVEGFRISNGTSDEEDGLIDEELGFQFTCDCATFKAFIGVVFYVGDIVSDLVVSCFWFRRGYHLLGGLSLFFTLIPTVILNCMSFNELKLERRVIRSNLGIELMPWVWRVTVVSHLFLLGPFIRFSKHFLHKYPLRKNVIKLKNLTLGEMRGYSIPLNLDSRVRLNMALIEGFLESAPQLILNFYTLSHITDDTESKARVIAQVASMLFSLFRLSWSVKKFHNTKIIGAENSKFGTVFNFLWHLNTYASRIISVALFATIFPCICLTVCFCHGVAASAWATYLVHKKKIETPISVVVMEKLKPILSVFIFVIGVFIYFFPFPERGKGPRRYRLLANYLIIGVENAMFITLWFAYVDNPQQWLKILAFVAVYVCYVMGVVFMIIYYRFFHLNILEHPERWKMKILFPEARALIMKINEKSKNEDNLKEDSGNEDIVNDSNNIYIETRTQ